MAFLPLYDNHAELIWYHSEDQVNRLKALPSNELRAEIVKHFPAELGDIEVLSSASFPIQRLHAKRYSHHNLLLLGDAAHSINPLAGQGVNLGFKDVAALLQLVERFGLPSQSAQLRALARRYECKRRPDNELMMSAMDALYLGFSNDFMPLRRFRNLGLHLVGSLPIAKKQILKYAAGC
jgi:2-octaprenyl-3-methyl-6-methoxy-1,4-benzoquinol hydroxylase